MSSDIDKTLFLLFKFFVQKLGHTFQFSGTFISDHKIRLGIYVLINIIILRLAGSSLVHKICNKFQPKNYDF